MQFLAYGHGCQSRQGMNTDKFDTVHQAERSRFQQGINKPKDEDHIISFFSCEFVTSDYLSVLYSVPIILFCGPVKILVESTEQKQHFKSCE